MRLQILSGAWWLLLEGTECGQHCNGHVLIGFNFFLFCVFFKTPKYNHNTVSEFSPFFSWKWFYLLFFRTFLPVPGASRLREGTLIWWPRTNTARQKKKEGRPGTTSSSMRAAASFSPSLKSTPPRLLATVRRSGGGQGRRADLFQRILQNKKKEWVSRWRTNQQWFTCLRRNQLLLRINNPVKMHHIRITHTKK